MNILNDGQTRDGAVVRGPEPWRNRDNDDEIDLAELGASLAAQARMILAVAVVGLGLSASYAFVVARPTYEATAVFAFNGSGSKVSLGSLGGLAALAGLPAGGSADDKLVFDRVTSADFIVKLADTAGLREDPFFNPSLGVSRREKLLAGLGLSLGPKHFTPAEIDAAIVDRFRKAVTLMATKNAAVTAKVSHTDAERAAIIANAVVAELLKDTLEEQMDRARSEVAYLGQQLADVQGEMDAAVGKLQDFSISRNALSVEDLLRRSSQLVQLRETRDRVATMRDGVAALIAANGSAEALRAVEADYPILSSTEFRLQAGLGASQTALESLDQAKLRAILTGIEAELAKLDASVRSAETNARISADEAAELLRLQRDVKVQEATYEAVVEQYKSRSIASGFQDAKGTMLQMAVPPVKPSAPKASLIIALGALLGLMAGAGLAIMRSLRRGILHTKNALLGEFGNVPFVATRRSKGKGAADGVELAALLGKGGVRHAVLWNLGSARGLARVADAAAEALAQAGMRVSVISLDPELRPRSAEAQLQITDAASKALRGSLAAEIEALGAKADRVIILAGNGIGPALALPSLANLHAPLVAFVEPKVTTRADIAKLTAVAQPNALILGY